MIFFGISKIFLRVFIFSRFFEISRIFEDFKGFVKTVYESFGVICPSPRATRLWFQIFRKDVASYLLLRPVSLH